VQCGDIAAGVGFKDLRTGDTLSAEDAPIVFESMVFPDPVIGVAVEPKSQKDLDSKLDLMRIPTRQLSQEWVSFTWRLLLID